MAITYAQIHELYLTAKDSLTNHVESSQQYHHGRWRSSEETLETLKEKSDKADLDEDALLRAIKELCESQKT